MKHLQKVSACSRAAVSQQGTSRLMSNVLLLPQHGLVLRLPRKKSSLRIQSRSENPEFVQLLLTEAVYQEGTELMVTT